MIVLSVIEIEESLYPPGFCPFSLSLRPVRRLVLSVEDFRRSASETNVRVSIS